MKRNQLLMTFILIFSFTLVATAQEKEKKKPDYGWKKEAVGILNFTQNQFDDWAGGGENA